MNEPPGFTDFTIGPLEPSQRSRVAEILRSTENFRDEEVAVALELFDASVGGDDYVFVGAFQREQGTGNRERDFGEGSRWERVKRPGGQEH